MKESINVNWTGGLSFSSEIDGHKISLDAKEEHGGENKGPRPKPLMMLALGGCSGMDVVSILAKMRITVDNFNIKIDGDITEEHPKHFTKMHITYEFTGKDLPLEKLEKAVELSQERYCGVSENYRQAMEITHEIVVLD